MFEFVYLQIVTFKYKPEQKEIKLPQTTHAISTFWTLR